MKMESRVYHDGGGGGGGGRGNLHDPSNHKRDTGSSATTTNGGSKQQQQQRRMHLLTSSSVAAAAGSADTSSSASARRGGGTNSSTTAAAHPALNRWQLENQRNGLNSANRSLSSGGGHFHRATTELHHLTRGGGGEGPLMTSSPTTNTARGSMRKILPPLPDMDTQMSLSAKMIDRRTSTPRGNHSYGPFFLEYSLLAEYNLLRKQKLSGVYVIPSTNSPLCWYGVIFVRHGQYQEGIFRFKIVIPENYPDGDCPRLFFDHPVFHPLISPGPPYEMCVRRGPLKKWRRNVNHIWQILLFVRRSFYKIDTIDPYNIEAASLYEAMVNGSCGGGESGRESDSMGGSLNGSSLHEDSETSAFSARVRECVTAWRDRIYEHPNIDDPHFLTFAPYEPKIHEPVRIAMVEEAKKLEAEEDQGITRNCHSLNLHPSHFQPDAGLDEENGVVNSLNAISIAATHHQQHSRNFPSLGLHPQLRPRQNPPPIVPPPPSMAAPPPGISFLEPGSLEIFSSRSAPIIHPNASQMA